MKVLLVGFHGYGDTMYPHLKAFIDLASGHDDCRLSYFHMRERGYFADRAMKQRNVLMSAGIVLKALMRIAIDSARLWIGPRDYDVVIAIDHLAYPIASSIFKGTRVVLWSFDIIGPDSSASRSKFTRFFMTRCRDALARNRRVIVQDRDRLDLLVQSLGVEAVLLDTYLMPVSLQESGLTKREISSATRPRLMQSGGIGRYRNSDKLLSHYQSAPQAYRLYFHGFVFPEITSQLATCATQPMVSSRTIDPGKMQQITDYCDIGFIAYADDTSMNFRLVAKASGQLVEFLRCGIPVVVMGENNLPAFVDGEGVGVAIGHVGELDDAVRSIAANYEQHSQACFRCFDRYFDLSRLLPGMLKWLQSQPPAAALPPAARSEHPR